MLFTDSMTVGEKLLNGLGITILGMGVVFVVLIIISLALDLLRITAGGNDKKKATADKEAVKADPVVNATASAQEDDEEIIAVIAAAIASLTGNSVESFFIQSIHPVPQKSTVWGAVGRQERMLNRL